MRYVNKFDFIVENVAQARAILNRKNISYDNPVFQKILDATKRDGYTGLITKMVFESPIDVDSALRLYDTMKQIKIDAGDTNIKKILDDENLSNMEKTSKIMHYVSEERKKLEKPYEFLFSDGVYKVFKVNNYQGILATGSPAWCLKTKSMFENYTTRQKGTQFVIVHERFVVTHDHEILLTTPNTWDGEHYTSGSYAKMRFGITIYPSGRMILFDDSNVQLENYRNSISDPRYDFLKPLLSRLFEYYKKTVKLPEVPDDFEAYDDFKDKVFDVLEGLGMNRSFSNIAPTYHGDVDAEFESFYAKVYQEMGLEEDAFYTTMGRFKTSILADDDWTQYDGYRDLLVNFMLTKTAVGDEIVSLLNCRNITAREHPLGGYFFDEQEPYDFIIKYHYGYQYTKYGKAGIEQGFGSVKNFYKEITDSFAQQLIDGEDIQVSSLNDFELSEVEDCITKKEEEDGYEITIDVKKILDLLDEKGMGGDISLESVNDEIRDILKPFFKGTVNDNRMKNIIVPIYTRKANKSDD